MHGKMASETRIVRNRGNLIVLVDSGSRDGRRFVISRISSFGIRSNASSISSQTSCPMGVVQRLIVSPETTSFVMVHWKIALFQQTHQPERTRCSRDWADRLEMNCGIGPNESLLKRDNAFRWAAENLSRAILWIVWLAESHSVSMR